MVGKSVYRRKCSRDNAQVTSIFQNHRASRDMFRETLVFIHKSICAGRCGRDTACPTKLHVTLSKS